MKITYLKKYEQNIFLSLILNSFTLNNKDRLKILLSETSSFIQTLQELNRPLIGKYKNVKHLSLLEMCQFL